MDGTNLSILEKRSEQATQRETHQENRTLKYVICEDSAWKALGPDKQKYFRKKYGRYCIVVPDFFFDWIDRKKYKFNLSPHAQMWIDECGANYVVDTRRHKGHVLRKIGEDKALGTTAYYWIMDECDVELTKMIDEFAKQIEKAIDAIPYTKPEKKKSDGSDAEPAEGSTQYIIRERNSILGEMKSILEKRYDSYAGYERDKIIRRIKTSKESSAVAMNDIEKTGSLIPMLNGLYDLRADKFRSAYPDDYLSVWAPTTYVENAADQAVSDFLKNITCKRPDLEKYMRQILGVGLDLNLQTRTLAEFFGSTTTNGKSTTVEALVACLGKGEEHGLAQILPPTVIAKSINSNNDSAITTSLGMIKYARLLFASEPPDGMKVNWALVKRLTGSGTVLCNEKYERTYNIEARATIIFDTNYTLTVDDPTLFSRKTIQIVPYDWNITDDIKDPDIGRKLSTESAKSAWMTWMLQGYREYVANGNKFDEPECAQEALLKNMERSDRIGCFMKENYLPSPDKGKALYLRRLWNEYVEWGGRNGYKHLETYPAFKRRMESNPQKYQIGEKDHQKALLGWVSQTKTDNFDNLSKTEAAIGDDPIGWYTNEYMTQDHVYAKKETSVTLLELHQDYVEKVSKAGGQAVEFWPLYGILMGRGWNITMETPGLESSVIVHGWHLTTEEERQERLMFEARKAENKIDNAIKILKDSGWLDAFLKDIRPDAKDVLYSRFQKGSSLEGFQLM